MYYTELRQATPPRQTSVTQSLKMPAPLPTAVPRAGLECAYEDGVSSTMFRLLSRPRVLLLMTMRKRMIRKRTMAEMGAIWEEHKEEEQEDKEQEGAGTQA